MRDQLQTPALCVCTRPRLCAMLILAMLVWLAPARGMVARPVALDAATIADLNAAFDAGTLTSEQLVAMYIARIEAYDRKGPTLRAVIALNPKAREIARALDAERKTKGPRSSLHGIPVVLKDNIDTTEMPTTGGSVLLEGSIPPDDAFIVKKLRAAGAIILAKVNLSEFASGPAYSSLGGQMANPHDLERTPAGSSGGTGVAIAAAYAQVGLGTDTSSSIRNPASAGGLAALRPTHGLMSRDGIIPLSLSFDMAGPLARSVYDVAVSLGVMTGVDPADEATRKSQGRFETDYVQFLEVDALEGARIGIARDFMGADVEVDWIIEQSLERMRGAGATIVDVRIPRWFLTLKGDIYTGVRSPETWPQLDAYLATLGPAYPKSVQEMLARGREWVGTRPDGAGPNPRRWEEFTRDANYGTMDGYRYKALRDHALPLAREVMEGIMTEQRLDAIVYPTSPRPPGMISRAPGGGGGGAATPSPLNIASLTGFPDLVVPAGFTSEHLPVTISFFGRAFSEPRLLALGYSFEQLTRARRLPTHTPLLVNQTVTLP